MNTKRNMRSVCLRLLPLLFALLLCAGLNARAETEYLDAARDAEAYRRAVAKMNAGLDTAKTRLFAAAMRGETVLCRTTGMKLTPDTFDGVCGAPSTLLAGPRGCYTMRFDDCRDAQAAIEWLNRQRWVIYAEEDAVIEAAGVAFDSWGAEAMGLGGYLPYAANWGDGSSTIAVLDSGAIAHPFFAGRVVNGYDHVEADDDPTNDVFGHGTRVTGIVADCTRDAPVRILSIRVLNDQGKGKLSSVVNGINEACDAGVDVINLSMAVNGVYAAIDDAVVSAMNRGVAVVVAAGNFNVDTAGVSPANITAEGVIVVGAAARSGGADVRASYSCFGDSVDVYAYGSGIMCCDIDGGYSSDSGTSFAAPHVSAVCALMKLLDPDMTPSQIEARLRLADSASDGLALKVTPLTPAEEGFRLTDLRLIPGETIALPTEALPRTCGERVVWSVDGAGLNLSGDGVLTAVSTGTGTLTATCRGFETCMIPVTITDDAPQTLCLPSAMTVIGDEAFINSGASLIEVPSNAASVGSLAFAENPDLRFIRVSGTGTEFAADALDGSAQAVLLCPEGSLALEAARDNGWQYIIQ